MAEPTPFVRVVVINFDGWQMTIDCLRSVLGSDWPPDRLEVVMVDNGSLDDVVDRVRVELPEVRIIEPLANTGFAGGCNLGITAPGSYDYVALVNNDATVDPGWLPALVAAFGADDRIGAACPKMLFEGRYVEAELDVPDAAPIGSDPRTLGVRLIGARIDGERDDARLSFDEGWFIAELPSRADGEELARWSWRRGRVRVRADGQVPTELALRVTSNAPRRATLRTARREASVTVDRGAPAWVAVELDEQPFDVVNNAGSGLYAGGFGGDRGFLERDGGQFDVPAEVFAWCGGAVLLSKAYLDDVGLFDERLFLYYEDTDLSWRGRLRGWRYWYEPTSVVRHRHAASSGGPGSLVFRYFTERNRVLVLVKNAPASLAVIQGLGLVKRALGVNVRDLVVRPLTLHGPRYEDARHQRRVLGGYLRLLPGMVRDRWRRPGPAVTRRSLMRWTLTKETAR